MSVNILLEMCELIVDCPHSTPKWTNSGFIVLRNQAIKNGSLSLKECSFTDEVHFKARTKRATPKGGDIVITREAPMGEVCKIPDNLICCLGQRQVLLRPKEDVDTDYLLYALQSRQVQEQILWNEGTGSTVSNLRIPVLEKLEIPRFRDKEKSIGKVLKNLDEKIHLNNQINQTLESIAQAIFKSWFIDFEPVKAKIAAKLEGKDPEVAAMCAISGKSETELEQMPEDDFAELQATAALFPDELVESELGEVPRGWEVKPLDKIANYLNGLALQKFRPENENDFLPIVKIAQLKSGRATTEEKASPNIDSKFIIDDGDIVFSWSGSLMVDIWCGGKAALNQHLFKVTSTEYPKWFYFSYTKRHLAEFQHIAQSKAVTMGHIKREHLSQALCVVPCMRLLRVGNNLIGTQLQKQIALRLENNTLIQVRDTLLPKLLSGEIDVSNLIEQDNGFIAGRVA